jgi:hypothetical protein
VIHNLDPKRPRTVRYRVLGLLALAALINYFHRFPMSVASETILIDPPFDEEQYFVDPPGGDDWLG